MKNDDLNDSKWREDALAYFRKIPMQYVSNASFETFYSNGYTQAKRSSQVEIEKMKQEFNEVYLPMHSSEVEKLKEQILNLQIEIGNLICDHKVSPLNIDNLRKENQKYKAAFEILRDFREMVDITMSYDDVFENVERCKIQAIGFHSIEAKEKVQEIMEGGK